MPRLTCLPRALCALLLAFAATPVNAGCADVPGLRNWVTSAKGPATFESRNGKFSFELPFAKQRLEMGSFGNRCFYAVNIDGRDGEHFSIEWVELNETLDDAGFVASWREFLPDYLAKNFGSGHYDLVAVEEFVDPKGRRSLRYAGTGTNNGGGAGSIIGVVTLLPTYRESNWANTYTIVFSALEDGVDPFAGSEARAVTRLSESIACHKSVCPKAARPPAPTPGEQP